jgi:chromosome segregation ATPase
LTSLVQTDKQRRGELEEAIIDLEKKLEDKRRERDALDKTIAHNISARDAMKQEGLPQYSLVEDISAKISANNREINDLESLVNQNMVAYGNLCSLLP